MKPIIDLSNKHFGKLIVIERDYIQEEKYKHWKSKPICWKCLCDCGNYISTTRTNLLNGNTTSCGCQKLLTNKQTKNRKYNYWVFKSEIAIGYTLDNQSFIIDADDYKKVKDFCWRISAQGYVVANGLNGTNKIIFIHRLIMNVNENMFVDHINWDKTNNTKSNLRICSKSENNSNIKKKINNTSGYTGVKYDKKSGKWKAQISYDNKRIHLGTFSTIEEAINIRQKAEINYHKEFNGELNRKNHLTLEEAQDIIEQNE